MSAHPDLKQPRTSGAARGSSALLVFALALLLFTVWPFQPSPSLLPADPSLSFPAGASANLSPVDLESFFTTQEMAKWKRYRLQKLWMSMIGLLSVLLFYFIFLLFGINRILKRLSHRLSDVCFDSRRQGRAGGRFPVLDGLLRIPERLYGSQEGLVVLAYAVLFVLLIRLVFLPQAFFRSFWFEHHYGLSTASIALWILDYTKSLLLGTVLMAFMVFGIYGLMNRIGNKWWLFLWAGLSAGMVGYAHLAPYRAHLYSNFHPLEPGELRSRLEELAQGQGVQLQEILVVDASRRTRKANAYFSGSGASQRIVLYDTLVEQFTPREVTMILAHELAHWLEPRRWLSYLTFSLTAFGILALASLILSLGSRISRFHYSSSRDIAGLPVLFLTFFLAFQVLRPANCAWKRAREIQADRRSLEMVCDPEAFLQTHVKLTHLNFSDVTPHPLVVSLSYSHPTFLQRAALAQTAECKTDSTGPAH